MTIEDLIKHSNLPINETEILLSSVFKEERTFLHAHLDTIVPDKIKDTFLRLLAQRQKGEPIQYLTNTAYFYGLEFYVDQNVLIPRPETEYMVEQALQFLRLLKRPTVVADIGTGSGNIIVAIAKHLDGQYPVKFFATDISPQALEVAKKNAKTHQVDKLITFYEGNLLEPLQEPLDMVVANLPYIPEDLYGMFDPQTKWEPKIALIAGKDGMLYYNQLFEQIPLKLKKDGLLLYENNGHIYQKTYLHEPNGS